MPHVVVGGPCVQGSEWPSTSRVILCQWHTDAHYLAINNTHFIWIVYTFASFPSDWIWCLCLDLHCLLLFILVFLFLFYLFIYLVFFIFYSGPVILVSSVVLRMSLLFWNRRLPSLGRSRVEHTHTTLLSRNCCNSFFIHISVDVGGEYSKASKITVNGISFMAFPSQIYAWSPKFGGLYEKQSANVIKFLAIASCC